MPYKDPEKQRAAMRQIMRRLHARAKKVIERYILCTAYFDNKEPLYFTITRDTEGKVSEFGIVTDKDIDFVLQRANKLGGVPDEIWSCQKLTPEECNLLLLRNGIDIVSTKQLKQKYPSLFADVIKQIQAEKDPRRREVIEKTVGIDRVQE